MFSQYDLVKVTASFKLVRVYILNMFISSIKKLLYIKYQIIKLTKLIRRIQIDESININVIFNIHIFKIIFASHRDY